MLIILAVLILLLVCILCFHQPTKAKDGFVGIPIYEVTFGTDTEREN